MRKLEIIAVSSSLALHILTLALLIFSFVHPDSNAPAPGMAVISVELIPSSQLQRTEKSTPQERKTGKSLMKKPDIFQQIKQESIAATAPQSAEQGTVSATAGNNNGPKIIYQPLPKIPDDLRRETYSLAAMARFHIAADGGMSVELSTPSQNPRLNRILLETLQTWKFAPATENGRRVASVFDIRVRFTVE